MQTGLILHVPEAEPVVARWRDEHDPNAPLGVPPHVTVLFPWLPYEQVTDAERAGLRELLADIAPIELAFRRFGRFPDVLWLAPEPAAPIRRLIAALAQRWPECPPYGGEYGSDPIPHLTVAARIDPHALPHVEAAITAQLPIRAIVAELTLMVQRDGRWHRAETFDLGGRVQPASGR